jgi:hypothetical protein
MRHWLKENIGTVAWCGALIIAALIFFLISQGSPYRQLAIGIFVSSVALPTALLAFEVLWWIGARALDALWGQSKSDNPQEG